MNIPRKVTVVFAVISATIALGVAGALPAFNAKAVAAELDANPYHPVMLWADSEELNGEGPINGHLAAVVDDDSGKEDSDKTFWHTKWQGDSDPFPHALVMAAKDGISTCGILYTARPTVGTTLGATNTPGLYEVYAFDKEPGKPTDMAGWREKAKKHEFVDGKAVSGGSLSAVNEPQVIAFPNGSSAKYFALVGLQAVDPSKAHMSASDIKLIPCAPKNSVAAQGSGVDDLVKDFYIDHIPFGEPGKNVWFSPDTHTYKASAYKYANAISLRIRLVEGASATINGLVPDKNGRVHLLLREGLNPIVAKVSKDGQTATYAVNVDKVNTDFQGNVPIVSKVVTNGGSAADNAAMTDGNQATVYTASPVVQNDNWSDSVTGFTINLDKPRYVSRINAWGFWDSKDPNIAWWETGSSVSIAVKEVGSSEYKQIADSAGMRRDNDGLYYWDFNRYYNAESFRIWLNPTEKRINLASVSFKDVELWGLPEGSKPVVDEVAPTGNTLSEMFDPGDGKWGTNRAQTLALQYGIMMPSWMPSSGYARAGFTKQFDELTHGFVAPMFYDPPLFNKEIMSRLKDAKWALAKAPKGGNSIGGFGEPRDFLTEEMLPYAKNLIDIQYGDEGRYSRSERDLFKKWFEFSKKQYPGAITHSNQCLGLGWDNQMSNYTQTAKPDLLSWDTYYVDANGGSLSSEKLVRDMLNNSLWKSQRQAALEGLDGDGKQPILFGQYVDYSWSTNMSASQKALIFNTSLATGMKWFGGFRVELNGYDSSSLVDYDGAPTRSFYEFADVFKQVRGFGKYLVPLNNEYLAIKPGQFASRQSTPKGYKMGEFAADSDLGLQYGVKDVSVTNLGGANDGKPGDVILGYFSKLPGLSEEKTKEIFGTDTTDPKAFMVVNGLSGDTSRPSTAHGLRTDFGAYWETKQEISVVVKAPKAASQLRMVDADNAKAVSLKASDGRARAANPTPELVSFKDNGDGTATLKLRLGGGQAALFYWTDDNPAPEPVVAKPVVDQPKAGETSVKVVVPTDADSVRVSVADKTVSVIKDKDGSWKLADGKALTIVDGKLVIPVDKLLAEQKVRVVNLFGEVSSVATELVVAKADPTPTPEPEPDKGVVIGNPPTVPALPPYDGKVPDNPKPEQPIVKPVVDQPKAGETSVKVKAPTDADNVSVTVGDKTISVTKDKDGSWKLADGKALTIVDGKLVIPVDKLQADQKVRVVNKLGETASEVIEVVVLKANDPKPVNPDPVDPNPGDGKPVDPNPGDGKPGGISPGDSSPGDTVKPENPIPSKPVDDTSKVDRGSGKTNIKVGKIVDNPSAHPSEVKISDSGDSDTVAKLARTGGLELFDYTLLGFVIIAVGIIGVRYRWMKN